MEFAFRISPFFAGAEVGNPGVALLQFRRSYHPPARSSLDSNGSEQSRVLWWLHLVVAVFQDEDCQDGVARNFRPQPAFTSRFADVRGFGHFAEQSSEAIECANFDPERNVLPLSPDRSEPGNRRPPPLGELSDHDDPSSLHDPTARFSVGHAANQCAPFAIAACFVVRFRKRYKLVRPIPSTCAVRTRLPWHMPSTR